MQITVSDLLDLARIGAATVRQNNKQNVISWLGYLPTEEDLNKAEKALEELVPLNTVCEV